MITKGQTIYGRYFDPTLKIASILERERKVKGYVESPKDHPYTGSALYYLCQRLDDEYATMCLASDPQEHAISKIILTNLADMHGTRKPDPMMDLETMVKATVSGFIRPLLSTYTEEQYKKDSKNYGKKKAQYVPEPYEGPYNRHRPIDTDLKLISDDIAGIIKYAREQLKTAKSFEDLMMITAATIIAEDIKDPDLKKQASDHISRKIPAEDLLKLAAIKHTLGSVNDLKKVSGQYVRRVTVDSYTDRIDRILEKKLMLRSKFFPEIAYEIEKKLGSVLNRVFYSSAGLHFELKKKIDEAYAKAEEENDQESVRERLRDILVETGIREEHQFQEHVQEIRSGRYRNLSRKSRFFDFRRYINALKKRSHSTPQYDPQDTDFTEGDKIVIVSAGRILRYGLDDCGCSPFTVPPGTVLTIKSTGEDAVRAEEKNGREYMFRKDEIRKVIGKGNNKGHTGQSFDTDISTTISSIAREVQTEYGFMFDHDTYEDTLRYCIYNLSRSGMNTSAIRLFLQPFLQNGLLDYAGKSKKVREWIFDDMRDGPKVQEKVQKQKTDADSTLDKVVSILSSEPSLVDARRIDLQDKEQKAQRDLCYLLMDDTDADTLNMFLSGDYPVQSYIISQLAARHHADTDEQLTSCAYSGKDIFEILNICAATVHQTLSAHRKYADDGSTGIDPEILGDMLGREDIKRYAELQDAVRNLEDMLCIAHSNKAEGHLIGTDIDGNPTDLFIEPESTLAKFLNQPMCHTVPDTRSLTSFELFKGLREGIDITAAAKFFVSQAEGCEKLVDDAYTRDDLRHIIAISSYASQLNDEQFIRSLDTSRPYEELFLETALEYIKDMLSNKTV